MKYVIYHILPKNAYLLALITPDNIYISNWQPSINAILDKDLYPIATDLSSKTPESLYRHLSHVNTKYTVKLLAIFEEKPTIELVTLTHPELLL